MKPQQGFVPERLAAMHCEQLLSRKDKPVDMLPALDRLASGMATRLAGALAALCGEGLEVAVSPAERIDANLLAATLGTLAGNGLLALQPGGEEFLVSTDAGAVLRLVDRLFGGPGELPEDLPARFSLSGELIAARLEEAVAAALAEAAGLPDRRLLKPVRRDSDIVRLAPFAEDCPLASCTLEVSHGSDPALSVTLAFPEATLTALAEGGMEIASEPRRIRRGGPDEPPFSAIPVPLRAVLVDMTLPLASVAQLRPGQVLPIAVSRNVPLTVGDATLARGTVGDFDDRIALKITELA